MNLQLLRRIDEQFLETPFYGSRQMARWLLRQGTRVSRKRVRRLMRLLGLQAIFQRPRTSEPHPEHRIYPYLLRDLAITRPNHVWCSDVTYIPLTRVFSIWSRSWIGREGWGPPLATPTQARTPKLLTYRTRDRDVIIT